MNRQFNHTPRKTRKRKPIVIRGKEIIIIAAEISITETKESIKMMNKFRRLFFENINKIGKLLTTLNKKKE